MLLSTLHIVEPAHSVLSVDLDPRLQNSLMQIKVIDRSDSGDQQLGPRRRDAIHQRSTHIAKVVFHGVATFDGLALRELGELVAATNMLGGGGFDGKVAGEHARGDLPAIGAVADERIDKAGCFGWLRELGSV